MTRQRTKGRNTRANQVTRKAWRKETKMILGIGTMLAIAAVALLVATNSGSSSSEPSVSSSGSSAADTAAGTGQLVREDSYRQEAVGSKVTIVEFLDLECEACGAMYPTVKQVLAEYEGRITFVVRYFPLHRNSVLAAKAAEAAGRQGKYWEMYALLFENQGSWGEKSQPQTEVFIRYAEALSLDMARFRSDLNDSTLEAKISRDKNDGVAAGVKGTPTFFINGVQAGSVMSYEQLKTRIDAALR